MFSLQKFFGKDPIFFELLEESAVISQQGAAVLGTLGSETQNVEAASQIAQLRKKSKDINEELGELIVKTFVTSLEKEDLESLSSALYKILKPIEKFCERYEISRDLVKDVDFSQQVTLIKIATDQVVRLIGEIKKSGNLEHVRALNKELQNTETEADRLELSLLKALYHSDSSTPLKVFIVKDLYDLLERAVDKCRDVGTVVMHIVLKNS